MPAKISGEGFESLFINAQMRHEKAFDEDVIALPIGGLYRYRANSEAHAYQANLIHLLQTRGRADSYSDYLKFARAPRDLPPIALRDLLDFVATKAGADRGGRIDHRNPQALRDAGDEPWRAVARSA
jgi:glutamate synthase (NADPH) large chain